MHLVLDDEALAQLATAAPAPDLLADLAAVKISGGDLVVPTSVVVERNHDPTARSVALANRLLRDAVDDSLGPERAAVAVGLRVRSGDHTSVVDAHVAAAALAVIRRRGGHAVVATSDPGDLTRLLDAAGDATRAAVVVRALR